MRFSEKYGYSEPRQSVQVEELDDRTRSRLWNVYWRRRLDILGPKKDFYNDLWDEHFGKRVDGRQNEDNIIKGVFEEYKWYDVIDIIEYISSYVGDIGVEFDFNEVLEEEKSAYRIVDGEAVPITDEIELESIEEGMEKTRKYEGVREHLEQALAHFSDENDPDYRNSVKESISAVESMAQIVVGNDDASLGTALSRLESNRGLNGKLKASFKKLYGYTSQEESIRHGDAEESEVSFAFAKFMLVNCTAFVNYLIDEYEAD